MNAISFEEWMAQVDRKLEATVGLTSADLADAPYRDNFNGEKLSNAEWLDLAYVILVDYNDMDEETFNSLVLGED